MQALHVTQFQQGAGAGTLVLLHGFPVDSRMWEKMAQTIDSSWRVLGIDLPGLGRSASVLPDEPSMVKAASLVRESLDALEATGGPVVFAGLSMGGYVLQAALGLYPDYIDGAIFLDTRANADAPDVIANRAKIADESLASGTPAAVLGMASGTLSVRNAEQRPELVDFMKAIISTQSGAGIAWSQRAMAGRPDAFEMLRTLDLPTLIIVGADDHVSPPEVMKELASAVAGARYVEIQDAGHMSPVEQPFTVSQEINAFLESLTAVI